MCFFFFSSRRRHTRWPRDWSSDVCSSDLRSRLELSAPAGYRAQAAQATGGGCGTNQGDRLEGAGPALQALCPAGGGRQGPAQDHHRRGARTAGLYLGHRSQGGNGKQAADGGLTKSKNKSKGKNFPKNEKTKTTQLMNSATQFEDRASSSRSKHEGESSSSLCDRLSRTRATSQRQLPTDHDHAVPTREYQTDQSSLKPAPTAARPVLEQQQQQQKKTTPQMCRG